MQIRKAETWCGRCTAPEVLPENVEPVLLFLRALPAWRTKGMDRICEGFDRGEVLALMELQGVADRAATWEALIDLEAELARIRAEASTDGQQHQHQAHHQR